MSVAKPEADNSVAAELASFIHDDRLKVNLFADETLGIANPVCFEWDAKDRLWVLCTWAYPQVKPGERPNDKLIILEDRDGDGRADHSSVFLDGLDMPTGFALGHKGIYIGEGHDLIHGDTDGDGKADCANCCSPTGTGDTHQNISSFAWSRRGTFFAKGFVARNDTVGRSSSRRTWFLADASVASTTEQLPSHQQWRESLGLRLWQMG